MRHTPFIWLFLSLALSLLPSCHEETANQSKNAAVIAREKQADELVKTGNRIVKQFEGIEGIIADIRNSRSLKKAEREMETIRKNIQEICREVRLKPKPDNVTKKMISKRLEKKMREMHRYVIAGLEQSEKVPPDLKIQAIEVMTNFLNGDHGLGVILDDYFKPTYSQLLPNPEYAQFIEPKLLSGISEPRNEEPEELPILAEPVEETPARLPAQIVEDDDNLE